MYNVNSPRGNLNQHQPLAHQPVVFVPTTGQQVMPRPDVNPIVVARPGLQQTHNVVVQQPDNYQKKKHYLKNLSHYVSKNQDELENQQAQLENSHSLSIDVAKFHVDQTSNLLEEAKTLINGGGILSHKRQLEFSRVYTRAISQSQRAKNLLQREENKQQYLQHNVVHVSVPLPQQGSNAYPQQIHQVVVPQNPQNFGARPLVNQLNQPRIPLSQQGTGQGGLHTLANNK